MFRSLRSLRPWLIAALPLLPSLAAACTIPVFRFALDRWPADPLILNLEAEAAASAEVRQLLRPLRANGTANLTIRETDTPGSAAALLLPDGRPPVLWSGTLDATTLEQILTSPSRQQISRQLLQGASMVWVVVDRGEKNNTPQIEHLKSRLRFLEQVVSLPPQDPDDPDSQLGPGPELKIHFSLVTVNGKDPKETAFIQMLAGPRQSLAAEGDSFAAAVFGRGRVLAALPLVQLDDPTLEDACMFLTGRCSCQVKNQNPGWDVVMDLDWQRELEQVAEKLAAHPRPAGPHPVMAQQTAAQPDPAAPAAAKPAQQITIKKPAPSPASASAQVEIQPATSVEPPAKPQAKPKAKSKAKSKAGPSSSGTAPPAKAPPPTAAKEGVETSVVRVQAAPPPPVSSIQRDPSIKDPFVFLPGRREASWAVLAAALTLVLGAGSAWVCRGSRAKTPTPESPPAPPQPAGNAPTDRVPLATAIAKTSARPQPLFNSPEPAAAIPLPTLLEPEEELAPPPPVPDLTLEDPSPAPPAAAPPPPSIPPPDIPPLPDLPPPSGADPVKDS
ncbi:MAG: hypothetical protein KDK99_06990 [Verrucomicrobiales bacterium]|nr:hypothetical protein [Verrucomicrobiales bacterium]